MNRMWCERELDVVRALRMGSPSAELRDHVLSCAVCAEAQDAAQVMFQLDNGGGVLGDVSYLGPDGLGYSAPQYWRVTCHGSEGFVEADYNTNRVLLATREDNTVRAISSEPDVPSGRLDDLLMEIRGELREGALSTDGVLRASRMSLLAQQLADQRP